MTIFKEFTMSQIFEFRETKAKINANSIDDFNGTYPYVTSSEKNNGIQGYIDYPKIYLNEGNTISLGMDTATFFYQKDAYFTGDKVKILSLLDKTANLSNIHPYLLTAVKKSFEAFSWGTDSYDNETLQSMKIKLPVKSKSSLSPDWNFMENYIKLYTPKYLNIIEDKGQSIISEIREKQNGIIEMLGIDDFKLSDSEEKLIKDLPLKKWQEISVSDIFDVIKPGKRLIEAQRIPGNLPFITAGVKNQGISSYISNLEIEIFPANSLTIDMFGKVFYRNFEYGADDHIAVIAKSDDSLSKEVLLFIAPIIEKSIHGQFDYAQNFYASDVYNVSIMLPFNNDNPDYDYMAKISKIMTKKSIQCYEHEIAQQEFEITRHKNDISVIVDNFLAKY